MTRPLIPIPHTIAPSHRIVELSDDTTLRVTGDAVLLDAVLAGLAPLAETARGVRVVEGPAESPVLVRSVAPQALAAVPVASGATPNRDGIPDERYTLTFDEGRTIVSAAEPAGAFRGLTALVQLLEVSQGLRIEASAVADGPRLSWRGLSLDVARHFLEVGDVRRVIDLLAWHRMNVLHMHLSDAQAWRLESAAYPALTAGNDGAYSAQDFRGLVAYAATRFVTIVPELDMPGHTSAAIAAYPELGDGAQFAHPFLVFLDPAVPAAVEFAETVLTELAALTPSEYLHIGGDEAFGMPDEKFAEFVARIVAHVRGLGRKVVGWQETTRSRALGAEDLAQFWISPKDAFDAEATKKRVSEDMHALVDLAAETFAHAPEDVDRARDTGVPIILSSSSPLYLDRRYAEGGDPAQAERRRRVGFDSYEPEPTSQLNQWHPDDEAEHRLAGLRIAGIEAAIWAESIDSFDDLAFLLLPRLAIAAERAWNPAAIEWPDTAARLRASASVWEALGFGQWYRSELVVPPSAHA